MNEVRVLVMTNFTYTYSSPSYKQCGDSMYFNPSSLEDLEELTFILDSSYMKKGWLYIEKNVQEDFKNKVGIFSKNTIVPEENIIEETIINSINTETISLENRKSQLEVMKAAEVKLIAEELGLEDYINKTSAIDYILKVEYTE